MDLSELDPELVDLLTNLLNENPLDRYNLCSLKVMFFLLKKET